eukprot:scaffold38702_cov37-Prasinocladus_malaysianus.AAC.1
MSVPGTPPTAAPSPEPQPPSDDFACVVEQPAAAKQNLRKRRGIMFAGGDDGSDASTKSLSGAINDNVNRHASVESNGRRSPLSNSFEKSNEDVAGQRVSMEFNNKHWPGGVGHGGLIDGNVVKQTSMESHGCRSPGGVSFDGPSDNAVDRHVSLEANSERLPGAISFAGLTNDDVDRQPSMESNGGRSPGEVSLKNAKDGKRASVDPCDGCQMSASVNFPDDGVDTRESMESNGKRSQTGVSFAGLSEDDIEEDSQKCRSSRVNFATGPVPPSTRLTTGSRKASTLSGKRRVKSLEENLARLRAAVVVMFPTRRRRLMRQINDLFDLHPAQHLQTSR